MQFWCSGGNVICLPSFLKSISICLRGVVFIPERNKLLIGKILESNENDNTYIHGFDP